MTRNIRQFVSGAWREWTLNGIVIKSHCVIRQANTWNFIFGVANSVVLDVRRVILGTRKRIKDLIGDLVDCGDCFRRPHNIFVRVRNVEVKPLVFDGTPVLPGY